MQSLLTFTLVIVAATMTLSAGEDEDCDASVFVIGECCSFSTVLTSPTLQDSYHECGKKVLEGKRPSTPSELNAALSCNVECVFSSEHLLTSDMRLDRAATKNYLTHDDPALTAVTSPIIKQCLDYSELNIDLSQDCKSGAKEFVDCFNREFFLDCPASLWQESSKCDEMKAEVIKCPKVLTTVALCKAAEAAMNITK